MTIDNAELRRFIDRALIVRLATLSGSGTPLLTPLWFARDRDVIYVGTRDNSPHTRNVLAHPRVVMLFSDDGGRPTPTTLRVIGTGRVRDYAEMSVRRQLKLFWRYSLRRESLARLLRDADRRRIRRRYRQERTGVMLEFTLESGEMLSPTLEH